MRRAHCIIQSVGTADVPGATVGLPYGTTVTYARSGRRLLERDRHGHELVRLSWRDDGTLASASVRIPDGSWLSIEPRASSDSPWGLSDRVWYHGTPLTVFAAIDYARIVFIPPLAEPARLPPGAGTAIFNLIASLASDQERGLLRYEGPYPSEELFLVLLESFRYEGGAKDPLQAFRAGRLSWAPAPHERHLTETGVWVQHRGRIEKIIWEKRAYYRPDWQGVLRHAARRIRDSEGGVVCSLWAFDGPVEDHLFVEANADRLTILTVAPPSPGVLPSAPGVLAGLAAVVAARSIPVLGPLIMEGVENLSLEWAPLTRDLVTLDEGCLRLSSRLLPLMRSRQAAASTPEERTGVAVAILAELAHVAGDLLRQRAQARLAALPESQQRRILEADVALPDVEIARAITGAVRALVAA
jgi:hypothetical protein